MPPQISANTAQGTQTEIDLLGPQTPDKIGKKTLVLDLDETLVHSQFKMPP